MLVYAPMAAAAQDLNLDSARTWQPIPSDGTEMRLSREGGALRLDFDFHGHAGYAIAHTPLDLVLPANYQISFRVRGAAPVENLELKLIDPSGENVWWDNRRDFRFPADWTTVRTRKRQIGFAWGPAGGGEPKRIGALEIVVTAGTGGKGTVWIDSLRLSARPPEGAALPVPLASASSSLPGAAPANALDGSAASAWRSAAGGEQWLALDLRQQRELGGLELVWGDPAAGAYDVQLSPDGSHWTTARQVAHGNGGRDFVYLPDGETRYLRLLLRGRAAGAGGAGLAGGVGGGARAGGYALRELVLEPPAFGATPDSLFAAVARAEPRGRYPRAYLGQQDYWTIVGRPGLGREALLDVDGRLEPARGSFSIEPFLYSGGRLLTWADAPSKPTLARGDLPIPSVRREAAGLRLTVSAFAAAGPDSGATRLLARYRVENAGASARRARLFLALRPMQVNPPWQFLATQGGFARIDSITLERSGWKVSGADSSLLLGGTAPDTLGATAFEGGDVTDWLAAGTVPPAPRAADPAGLASGALAYDLALPAGGAADIWLDLPLAGAGGAALLPGDRAGAAARGAKLLAAEQQRWAGLLDRAGLELGGPGAEVARALRTNLAYILLNRDGPALRPGSRSYARSWIRDGALMSLALLRLGHAAEVRDYIRWYAPFQFPSGKVPCCVDARGADPVPENDSHGELIWLVAEYFRFTRDTALVREVWPHVAAAAAYIDTLRQQRLTPEYTSGPRRLFHGLLPESISHEGYSAKPMHSYWDDLWGERGLEDAALLAGVLGRGPEAATWSARAASFRADIVASMQASMAEHHVDYLPGAAELGDFDATSTAIGLSPLGDMGWLPRPALQRTFERYWREFVARRDGQKPWENYTPYEWRVVGAFARLGWRERAAEALRFFMADRRPPAWNEWAEVVWRDPATPRFIGDMPHTWVAAEFVRSVLDLLVYERDDALVVGAGVPPAWLEGAGVALRGLGTSFGALDLRMRREGDVTHVRLAGDLRLPPGGILLALPGTRFTMNGREIQAESAGVVVRSLPARIEIRGK